MASERYELSWKEFDQCTSQSFRKHFKKEDFSDVTLACDDYKQIKSHKMILSACSPFFQKVLLNNPHQHPLIYLKGVTFASLELILQFMYLGETKVSENELQHFLDAAEELKVLGLSDSSKFRKDLGLPANNSSAAPSTASSLQSDQFEQKPVMTNNLPSNTTISSDSSSLYAEYSIPVNQMSDNSLLKSETTSANPGYRVINTNTSSPSMSRSQSAPKLVRKPSIKKESNTVRCNLCQMLIINNEKCLLEHVQRMHGA